MLEKILASSKPAARQAPIELPNDEPADAASDASLDVMISMAEAWIGQEDDRTDATVMQGVLTQLRSLKAKETSETD